MHAIVFEKLITIAHQRSVVYDPFAMSYSPSLQVYLKLALQGLPYALLFISIPRVFSRQYPIARVLRLVISPLSIARLCRLIPDAIGCRIVV